MTLEAISDHFFLGRLLEPLRAHLDHPEITDLFINRPGELWIETLGGQTVKEEAPELTHEMLDRIARQAAAFAHQGISRESPLLAARLPDGARIQIVLPPATRGDISISIRRHVMSELELSDYEQRHLFPEEADGSEARKRNAALCELLGAKEYARGLALAVGQRRNILISGGTSSGKTTFLNALLREIPEDERLIVIEDTPELHIRHDNAVGLVAVRGQEGEARVTADDLVTASLRMRPDRIILGELRGGEAFTFLRAVNTGHPGSMTTIHADCPDRAVEQLALLILQRGSALRRRDVVDYVSSIIDLYVQLERGPEGRRISEVRTGSHLTAPRRAAGSACFPVS